MQVQEPELNTESQKEALQRLQALFDSERRQRAVFSREGEIDAVEEAGGGRFEYIYGERGDLVRITEANGMSTAYAYDDLRRLVRVEGSGGTIRYKYSENGRLVEIDDRGIRSRFEHDAAMRITMMQRGNAGASVFRYDAQGRVIEARTSSVSTRYDFDPGGRVVIQQTIDGVAISASLEYDGEGRLAKMVLPGSNIPISYSWDDKGRPQTVAFNGVTIAQYEYVDDLGTAYVRFSNGLIEKTRTNADCRPMLQQVLAGEQVIFDREYDYLAGQMVTDGVRSYSYDQLGRLCRVGEPQSESFWTYSYDNMDNRTEVVDAGGHCHFTYDGDNRLVNVQAGGNETRIGHDRFGRPTHKSAPDGQWTYRYDDSGQLLQVLYRGNTQAQFTYDHKGRLALFKSSKRTERYLYGRDDELLAVTDEAGNPSRLYVRTPFGAVAEVHGSINEGELFFLHTDRQGTCHLTTDQAGKVVGEQSYDPFGVPLADCDFLPVFTGRIWYPEINMYYFGARWYDPHAGRFLTPDSYTGGPDDERLVHPLWPGTRQVFARAEILSEWLKRPRVRNRYAYCGNDPANSLDTNGHWSFGGVLLTLLGVIWTLPNTLFGLMLEITCLISEVVRWLVWLVSLGHVSWETPGFDAASSGRLNAFALVFSGGWLGSIRSLVGITFGNVIFVYKNWQDDPEVGGPGDVFPTAYGGRVSIPRREALYEHELRHTNQYGWLGPFFHLGLPIFGAYLWDIILSHGYCNAWFERDARAHGGV